MGILSDVKEFTSGYKPKQKLTKQRVAYNMQRAGFVDPRYHIPKPIIKKKKVKKRRKGKGYVIVKGKAYPIK